MNIAIYLRLSKEDGEAQESSSIRGQRTLLQAYAKEHFPQGQIREFQDDGCTGLHMARPGLQAMLEQVRRGRIDCVMVKDFSRFSRDYLELGEYIQQIFPLLGVRFISVGERYDSQKAVNGPGLAEQFQGLVYHLYSRDLSAKVKTALEIRRRQGKYVWGRCPFGYERAPDMPGGVAIRQEEIQTVREIFRLALEGESTVAIAELLNKKGVPTPMEALCARGESRRKPRKGLYLWSHETVGRILENPFYAGDLEVYKTQPQGTGKRRASPRKERLLIKGHHEAAIERGTFEQAALKRRGGRMGERQPRPLTGLLRCGVCGRGLVLKRGKAPAYYCQRRRESGLRDCGFLVEAETFEQAVLEILRLWLGLLADRERLKEKMGQQARELARREREDGLKQRRKEAGDARRRLARYEREGAGEGKNKKEKSGDRADSEPRKGREEKSGKLREALENLDAPGLLWLDALGGRSLEALCPSLWIARLTFYGPDKMELRWRFQSPWRGEDCAGQPSITRRRE